jgi:hypothetical protein
VSTDTTPGSLLTTEASASTEPHAEPATAPAGQEATQEKDEPQGAPEKYEFATPEGVKFDEGITEKLSALAKEKNLSQEDAQKFADLGVEVAKQTRDAYAKQIEEVQMKWANDSRVDKEFGGDKLAANMAVSKRALEAFGSPELKQMLNETGLGNHPEIIRAFFRVGQAISEDKLVPGGKAPNTAGDARSFYGNSQMNP